MRKLTILAAVLMAVAACNPAGRNIDITKAGAKAGTDIDNAPVIQR